ncbi:hypothetical protein [Desulfovibrio inopinatus]|uniref:hypothetical protein n=1 Tax=Desulfovibrio inopinatus TaxID=102109 RepID=UPI0004084FCB|nr:hypothetical protein [Desulfovibrio inopinatus]
MADSLSYLDTALETGRKELDLILRGEVEEAGKLADERGKLLNMAWKERDGVQIANLRQKLVQLQTLQGQISHEAKRLHEQLRLELTKTKQENKRFSGYRSTVKPKSIFSKFISKIG